MPDLITREANSSDFEDGDGDNDDGDGDGDGDGDDDDDSLPDRRHRAQSHLVFSGGDYVDDDAADDEANDDDQHHDTGAPTAGVAAQRPARLLPLADDPELPTHAYYPSKTTPARVRTA